VVEAARPTFPPEVRTFADFRRGFRRSRKGNRWCQLQSPRCGELGLTVFPKGGGYRWCCVWRGSPSYSGTFPTEEEALRDLWQALGGPAHEAGELADVGV
jgi:hypothetical protein